jgi:predicted phosphodiesterase
MDAVVISDTHFGTESSTLTDPMKVDVLIKEITGGVNGCNEAILLGDILDFWRAPPEKAVRDSRYFLKRLSEVGLKVRYVVGNHDHHLVVMNQEGEFRERMARGDLYPIYVPALRWSQTIDGMRIEMLYPTYQARCCQRTFLFTHGHHLNGIQAISLRLVDCLRQLSGEELSPADLERMLTYAYESIYRSSCMGDVVKFEESLWKASVLFRRFREGVLKTLRFTPVEIHYDAILKFLCDQNLGRVDCFVYGDTHRADIYQRKGGPLAINSGSFTRDGAMSSGQDTYLIVKEEGISLRRLGIREPVFRCELL